MKSNPYHIIKSRYITEKASTLQGLKEAESNRCLAKFNKAKYVFIVDKKATKIEIKAALEEIYKEKNIVVESVNTINTKPKKRRVRGRLGFRPSMKKAIVTLEEGDLLDEQK